MRLVAMHSLALGVILALLPSVVAAGQTAPRSEKGKTTGGVTLSFAEKRVAEWTTAVETHAAGTVDQPLRTVASWPREQVTLVVRLVVERLHPLLEAREFVYQQEVAELTRRRDAQEDPTARATMEQSLALCTGRLEHARRVEPAREQVAAQQELILQTMASVHAGLARICAAGSTPAGVDVHELQESVAGVSRQARAVEEAVTEVIALRA